MAARCLDCHCCLLTSFCADRCSTHFAPSHQQTTKRVAAGGPQSKPKPKPNGDAAAKPSRPAAAAEPLHAKLDAAERAKPAGSDERTQQQQGRAIKGGGAHQHAKAASAEPSPVSSREAGSGQQQHKRKQQQQRRLPNNGAGVEVILEHGHGGGGGAGDSGRLTLKLQELASFRELWRKLEAAFPGQLPPRAQARLVFLDDTGDWVMVTADQRWGAFVQGAHKVVVHSAAGA